MACSSVWSRIGLADLLATVDATSHLDWLLLTKRPELAEKRLKAIGVWKSWPRPNIWLGASAENQRRADERIPILIDIPAHVHFLSCELLLGPIDLQLSHIEWLIAGGEPGTRHRPMHADWARSLRDQCIAHVSFFFKQWGFTLLAGCNSLPGIPAPALKIPPSGRLFRVQVQPHL